MQSSDAFSSDGLEEPAPQVFHLCFLTIELLGCVIGDALIVGGHQLVHPSDLFDSAFNSLPLDLLLV